MDELKELLETFDDAAESIVDEFDGLFDFSL